MNPRTEKVTLVKDRDDLPALDNDENGIRERDYPLTSRKP